MQYNRLGNSGLIVSRMALGTMTFGLAPQQARHAIVKVDQALANDLVARALDAGINLFDTADVYAGGASESFLKTALGSRRRDVVLASKIGNRMGGGLLNTGLSRRHIIASVDGCLERLGTDWLDVLYCHRNDQMTPLDETLEAVEQLIRAGKIRYAGFSNWPAWRASQAIERQKARNHSSFCTAELYYSLVGRDAENELLPLCADQGIGVVVWSPLSGGFLTGRYLGDDPTGGGGRLAEFNTLPVDPATGKAVLAALGKIAAETGASYAQIALSWVLSRPVASVVIGASSLIQLDDNLAAGDIQLSNEHLAELQKASTRPLPYPQWVDTALSDRAVARALGKGIPGTDQ